MKRNIRLRGPSWENQYVPVSDEVKEHMESVVAEMKVAFDEYCERRIMKRYKKRGLPRC